MFLPQKQRVSVSDVPECPVLVFINSKSGGELLVTYHSSLNKNQVFDLGEEASDTVLIVKGSRRRNVVVVGGGIAGWLLGVVSDLKLSQPPPIATVPLGMESFCPLHLVGNIAQLCMVKIMKKQNEWLELEIPPSIRSIICLNLPSFSGGINPWGTPCMNRRKDRDLVPPFVDDGGLLEIVGFKDAWHGLILQAQRIRFEFHKGGAEET